MAGEEENWSDWEDEGAAAEAKCLLCSYTAVPDACMAHMRAVHDLDLPRAIPKLGRKASLAHSDPFFSVMHAKELSSVLLSVSVLGMDQYGAIKLINYIRHQVSCQELTLLTVGLAAIIHRRHVGGAGPSIGHMLSLHTTRGCLISGR